FYGPPGAYYGTVEQQGRLTLHLHVMLWIKNSYSPKQIRDRILRKDSEFQKAFVDYLETAHMGEFQTGTMDEVKAKVPRNIAAKHQGVAALRTENGQAVDGLSYCDPTLTLPQPPPELQRACDDSAPCSKCDHCASMPLWWSWCRQVCDDLVFRSNVHVCRDKKDKKVASTGHEPMVAAQKACRDKDGACRARFPREVYPETAVDPEDGHIFLKKLEEMINTYTPLLTYLLRCNTDVTCLNSGTSMCEVIKYVTDYITKVSLKSHHIFSAALDIYQR
ncbi:hypothetical protein BKA70DRAFT_1041076, partial [Coprinopsis sp. MPI-PUGE-AT-0042]